jgi:secondary thiamine-phosphate synthase enzyme
MSIPAEGKDDMPAHIKSALTNNQISLSIKDSKLLLGTWQGLYLFEHRLETQNRTYYPSLYWRLVNKLLTF